jgi:uncharacterized membrane protein YhiD involved in acid resistance
MQPSPFDILFTNEPTIFAGAVLVNVLLAFVLGLIISVIYRVTYKGYAYSATFVNTLIIISMVTSIVIMVIGSNLARAFGLVGAMSIIRFRSAVKDTRDIAFVFFALAAGMAGGSGNHMIGIIGCLIGSIIILVLYFTNYGQIFRQELLLKFWMIPEEGEEPVYMQVFNKYLSNNILINVRSARLGQFVELSFNVRFKRDDQYRLFIRDLSSLEGIDRVSLVMGEVHE